jgi:hypothetical protein
VSPSRRCAPPDETRLGGAKDVELALQRNGAKLGARWLKVDRVRHTPPCNAAHHRAPLHPGAAQNHGATQRTTVQRSAPLA